MEIYSGARRSGKTHKLAELLLADPNGIIVTHNLREARNIVEEYRLMPDQVVAVNRTNDLLQGRDTSSLYIDNLEMVLADIFYPHFPKVATFSGRGIKMRGLI